MEKLAQLRAKTDRQLVTLIDNTLDRARRFADLFPCEAERAHAEAASLLSAVAPKERSRLQRELRRVDGLLHTRTFAAC